MNPSVAQRIRAFNAGRDPVRLRMKYRAMAKNAFTFFRGTSHLFWEDWGKRNPLDAVPAAWSTGDLHFENFGAFKGENRVECFDINDFDDACLAPCLRDPARGACSVLLAAAERRLPRSEGRLLALIFLDAYRTVLLHGVVRWVERRTARGAVRRLLKGLAKRTRKRLLQKRTRVSRSGRPRILLGKYALPATRREHAWIRKVMGQAQRGDDPVSFRVIDAARRIAGTGSLGVERYTVLVEGRGSPLRNTLIDLKAAQPSSMAVSNPVRQPGWAGEAQRVVWIQTHMQAASPALLRAVTAGSRSYVLRELQPREDRLQLKRLSPGELHSSVHVMGALLGWAQLRASGRRGAAGADELQGFAARPGWRTEVLRYATAYASRVLDEQEEFKAAWKKGFFGA